MPAFLEHVLFFRQKKQVVRKQGGKKKKQILKFTLDCTHPVEDGIMDAANFVSYAAPCGQHAWHISKNKPTILNIVTTVKKKTYLKQLVWCKMTAIFSLMLVMYKVQNIGSFALVKKCFFQLLLPNLAGVFCIYRNSSCKSASKWTAKQATLEVVWCQSKGARVKSPLTRRFPSQRGMKPCDSCWETTGDNVIWHRIFSG